MVQTFAVAKGSREVLSRAPAIAWGMRFLALAALVALALAPVPTAAADIGHMPGYIDRCPNPLAAHDPLVIVLEVIHLLMECLDPSRPCSVPPDLAALGRLDVLA